MTIDIDEEERPLRTSLEGQSEEEEEESDDEGVTIVDGEFSSLLSQSYYTFD